MLSAQEVFAFNSTALAVQEASKPHLSQAIFQLLGVVLKEPGRKPVTPAPVPPRSAELLLKFFAKLSKFYALPSAAAISFFQEFLFLVFCAWFLVNAIAFLIWLIYPDSLKKKISVPL